MTVIAFGRPHGAWSATELATLTGTLGLSAEGGDWATGVTDCGDVQFYVLGPRPEQACMVCVSRVDGLYIAEDGHGRLVGEHRSLPLAAAHARNALRATRWWLAARIVVVWCTFRHMIHDKIEPLMTEGEELLVHLAPQLAALA